MYKMIPDIDPGKVPPPGRKPYQIILTNITTREERIFPGTAAAGQFLGVGKLHINKIVRPSYKYRKILKGMDGNLYSIRQEEKLNVEDGSICHVGLSEKEAREFVEKFNKFGTRVCLICNQPFRSSGPWNRRCDACENSGNFQSNFTHLREHKISAPGTARRRSD